MTVTMSGIATWTAAGAVIGIAGRLLLPGPRSGWPTALGLGIVGALLGGVAATWLGMGGVAELEPRAATLALLSAALVVIVAQLGRSLAARRSTDSDTGRVQGTADR